MSHAEGLARKVEALIPRAFTDLAELVALRSVANPALELLDECERAAKWVVDAFVDLGFENVEARLTADGSKAVIAEAPGPEGAPTVLLYTHYDVEPASYDEAWSTPPFELTENGGRWYGRGSADSKGNLLAHLTALRALGHPPYPVTVKVAIEGSEEQATGGIEALLAEEPDLMRADAIIVADAGSFSSGVPTLTSWLRGIVIVDVRLKALAGPVHSGMLGGPAPDPLAALILLLGSLWDQHGEVTIDGLTGRPAWQGGEYPTERFRQEAGVLEGVHLTGEGTVAEGLWAQPALTVVGIDVPAVVGAPTAIQPTTAARLSLRIPPGTDAQEAEEKLVEHLRRRVPWGLRSSFEPVGSGQPFVAELDGPAGRAMSAALEEAYRAELFVQGVGGAIPFCAALASAYPEAEVLVLGVADPESRIHGADESVNAADIERVALAEALFLERYARAAADAR